MKKYIFLTLTLGVIGTMSAMGQDGELKGPEAKNSKPWKSTKDYAMLVSTNKKRLKKGPATKNMQVWAQKVPSTPIVWKKRIDLKGPAAKNKRPERNAMIN